MEKRRIVVGMSGASGAILGIRLLQELRKADIETHLVLSDWAKKTIELETDYTVDDVCSLADLVHAADNMAACISSGSFRTDGMVLVPCSMKTLSAVANGFSYNLIVRAADVTLKERRPLVVVPRETPLSPIHLRNMLSLSGDGAILLPPCIGFYTGPKNLDEAIDHIVGKIMDELHIANHLYKRWEGTEYCQKEENNGFSR